MDGYSCGWLGGECLSLSLKPVHTYTFIHAPIEESLNIDSIYLKLAAISSYLMASFLPSPSELRIEIERKVVS